MANYARTNSKTTLWLASDDPEGLAGTCEFVIPNVYE
jgi:hypothetical protein